MNLDRKIEHAEAILRSAFAEHEPVSVLAGFSGGHDSLVATHLTMRVFPEAKAFHVNTGIGIEKTRQFVRDVCDRKGWALEEVMPEDHTGKPYRELVMRWGFPGPPSHNMMYRHLKERGIEALMRQEKAGKSRMSRVMFVTGVRREESVRRMGTVEEVQRQGARIWAAPIIEFSGDDKNAYIKRFNLPRNAVVDTLGMSGECLCGAYAHQGEKDLVRIVDPATADYIEALEQDVHAAGWKWPWEGRPSNALILEKHGQGSLFAPMCVGCEKMHDEREAA